MDKSTRGLVLREVNYRDADKILSVLTETEGKITVSARGAKRKNSKFTASAQLLAFSEMNLYQRQGKWYMREASAVELFGGLRSDIALLALGSYFAELLEAVSDEDSQNLEILQLGLSALYILSKNDRPMELVKAAFELRLMCLAGYEPLLNYCRTCSEVPEKPIFDIGAGTVVCGKCTGGEERAAGNQLIKLCQGSYNAAQYIAGARADRVFSFSLGDRALKRLEDMCENYMTSRLERRFKTLDFWKGIR